MLENFIIRPYSSYSIHSLKAKKEKTSTPRSICLTKDTSFKQNFGKLYKGLPLTKASENQKSYRVQSACYNPYIDNYETTKEESRPNTTKSSKRKYHLKPRNDDQFENKFLDFDIDNKPSSKFGNIYFMNVPYKEALNNVNVPQNSTTIKSSSKDYERLYKLMKEIFSEIEISPLSLFVIKSSKLDNYSIYILENGLVPISKCCDALVSIEVNFFKRGLIKCSGNLCKNSLIFEFTVPQKNKELTFEHFDIVDTKDRAVRKNISRNVTSGKYRYNKLIDEVNNCIKEVDYKVETAGKKISSRPWTSQGNFFNLNDKNNIHSQRQLKFRKINFTPTLLLKKSIKGHLNQIIPNIEVIENDKTIDDIREMIENL